MVESGLILDAFAWISGVALPLQRRKLCLHLPEKLLPSCCCGPTTKAVMEMQRLWLCRGIAPWETLS